MKVAKNSNSPASKFAVFFGDNNAVVGFVFFAGGGKFYF